MAAVKTGSGKSSKPSPKSPAASPAKKSPPKTAKPPKAPVGPEAGFTAKWPTPGTGNVYQLKIVLTGSEPVIWRRVLVFGKMTLDVLHELIQATMGWNNSHMHLFRLGKQIYANSRQMDEGARDEDSTTLAELVPAEKGHFEYVYDFGDDWHHEVFVEKIGPGSPGAQLPSCLAGENACPPEDCGGIPGYLDMLEVLKDPDHEEFEDTQEWIGDTFEPFQFDVKATNARLKKAGF